MNVTLYNTTQKYSSSAYPNLISRHSFLSNLPSQDTSEATYDIFPPALSFTWKDTLEVHVNSLKEPILGESGVLKWPWIYTGQIYILWEKKLNILNQTLLENI